MAVAQNVRSGSNPDSTYDPDLRSRPFEKIWFRPLEWCIGKLILGPTMLAYFGVSCSAVIHPAKQPSNKLLQSYAAKLLSFQAALVVKLRCWAVKQSSSQAATVAHPCCQIAKLTLLQVVRPVCEAAKLVVLFLSCCIQAVTYTNI